MILDQLPGVDSFFVGHFQHPHTPQRRLPDRDVCCIYLWDRLEIMASPFSFSKPSKILPYSMDGRDIVCYSAVPEIN